MYVKRIIKNKRGFSMIEMVYVFVLLGILTAISAPSFVSFLRSSRVNGAQNELMADLHYARGLALKERRTHHVEFTANQYVIKETATDTVVRTREMPDGVTVNATADPNFYAWGLADPVTINLDGGNGVKSVALAANGSVSHY